MLPFPPQGCCRMPLESASSLLPLAAIAAGLALLVACCLPSRKPASASDTDLDSKIATLQDLLHLARQEAQRLDHLIEQARTIKPAQPGDALAVIENLGDPAAMADSAALTYAADQLSDLADGAAAD